MKKVLATFTAALYLCSLCFSAEAIEYEIKYTRRYIFGEQEVQKWRRTQPLTVSSFESGDHPEVRSESGTVVLSSAGDSWKIEVKGLGYEKVTVWDGKRMFDKVQNQVTVHSQCDPTFLHVLPRIGQNYPSLPVYKPAEIENSVFVLDHRVRRQDRKVQYNLTRLLTGNDQLLVLAEASILPVASELRVSPNRFESVLDHPRHLTYETFDIVRVARSTGTEAMSILPYLSEKTTIQFPGPIAFRFNPKGGTLDEQLEREKLLRSGNDGEESSQMQQPRSGANVWGVLLAVLTVSGCAIGLLRRS